MNDMLVLALVLLLVASGYAAGRVHGEVGYRTGFRSGYRQGHADGSRFRPADGRAQAPAAGLQAALGSDDHGASDSRQYGPVTGVGAHAARHPRR